MTEATVTQALTPTTSEELKRTIAKIERLEEDKKAVAEDIKAVYANAKSLGFDVKAIRAILAKRKKDRQELETLEAIVELYEGALDGQVN